MIDKILVLLELYDSETAMELLDMICDASVDTTQILDKIAEINEN